MGNDRLNPQSGLSLDNTHVFAVHRAFHAKFDFAVRLCVQRVVLATTDVITCVKTSTALTNENVARDNHLTPEALYAESF